MIKNESTKNCCIIEFDMINGLRDIYYEKEMNM